MKASLIPSPEDKIFHEYLQSEVYPTCVARDVFKDSKASEFIGHLLKDCLAIDPKDRPSEGQLAEMLLVLGSYFESKESGEEATLPTYSEVKKEAERRHPKTMPIYLTRALLSAYPNSRKNPCNAIFRLVELEPSLENTPTYGLALFFQAFLDKKISNKPPKDFEIWREKHPDTFQQLLTRIYTLGNKRKPGRDMPMLPNDCKALRDYARSIPPPPGVDRDPER